MAVILPALVAGMITLWISPRQPGESNVDILSRFTDVNSAASILIGAFLALVASFNSAGTISGCNVVANNHVIQSKDSRTGLENYWNHCKELQIWEKP
jgi:hypothetical protein